MFKSYNFLPKSSPIVGSLYLSAAPSISASPLSLSLFLPVAICSKMDVPWERKRGESGSTSLRLLLQLRQHRFGREWGKSLKRVQRKLLGEVSRLRLTDVPNLTFSAHLLNIIIFLYALQELWLNVLGLQGWLKCNTTGKDAHATSRCDLWEVRKESGGGGERKDRETQ